LVLFFTPLSARSWLALGAACWAAAMAGVKTMDDAAASAMNLPGNLMDFDIDPSSFPFVL
jgi:hypothetical protein